MSLILNFVPNQKRHLNQSLYMQFFYKEIPIINWSYNFVNYTWLIEYNLTISHALLVIMWQIPNNRTYIWARSYYINHIEFT